MSKASARSVLWYLAFVGFAVNYMIRINLNIAIVDMVVSKSARLPTPTPAPALDLSGLDTSGSFNNSDFSVVNNNSAYSDLDVSKRAKFSVEKWVLDKLQIPSERNGFHWNEYQQGLILGSFFWLHWVTQIPGGILARKYGTKLVFGLSNAICCWMCFLIPMVSYMDYRLLILIRVLQGLIGGLSWPAMHNMTAHWIPPNERSKFVTAYLGSSVGIALFYPLFGYVIAWSSWEWVFHICGIIGTLWYIGWTIFVFDSPSSHPRISVTELRFIEKSLGASVQKSHAGHTPWKNILTSRAVWMNVIAQWGGIWGLFTLMTQAPTYFKVVHKWDIRTTGIISGLPHVMRMLFAMLFSYFGDYLMSSGKMSVTNVRKLATSFCTIVNGIFVLGLAYFGSDPTSAVVYLTLATMVHGTVSSGPLASIVDIAPNFAGVVLGLSGMIGVVPGFISPIIVGHLTVGNQTLESWKYVFLITAGWLIGCGVLYVLFADSTLQSWNSPKHAVAHTDKEMQLLNKETTVISVKEYADAEKWKDEKQMVY